jgi:hypothetical protein
MAKGLRAKSEKRKRTIKRQKVAKLEDQRLKRIVARLHEQIHLDEQNKKNQTNNSNSSDSNLMSSTLMKTFKFHSFFFKSNLFFSS